MSNKFKLNPHRVILGFRSLLLFRIKSGRALRLLKTRDPESFSCLQFSWGPDIKKIRHSAHASLEFSKFRDDARKGLNDYAFGEPR